MSYIIDIFTIIKFGLLNLRNFYARNRFYAMIYPFLMFCFIILLFAVSLLVVENTFIVPSVKFFLKDPGKYLLFISSLKLFFLFILAGFCEIYLLKNLQNNFKEISDLKITPIAKFIFSLVYLICSNPVNAPLIIIMLCLGLDCFSNYYIGILFIFFLFLILKYIFIVFLVFIFQKALKYLSLNVLKTLNFIIISIALYVLFFIGFDDFGLNSIIHEYIKFFEFSFYSFIPTFWVIVILIGVLTLNLKVLVSGFVYILVLFAISIAVNYKISINQLLSSDILKKTHEIDNTEENRFIGHNQIYELKDLFLYEFLSYYPTFKLIIFGTILSFAASYYYSIFFLPGVFIFLFVILFDNITYSEKFCMFSSKSSLYDLWKIYWIKHILLLIFNLCFMAISITLIYFFNYEKDLIDISKPIFYIIPVIWIKQFLLDLYFLMKSFKPCDVELKYTKKSIRFIVINFVNFILIMIVFELGSSLKGDNYYTSAAEAALIFLIIHISIFAAIIKKIRMNM